MNIKQFLPKLLFLSFVGLIFSMSVFAQNARETIVKFKKVNQTAVVADYEAPKKIVEDALKARLDKAGLGKRKTSKGYMTYTGTIWQEITTDKVDVYVKVSGKKDKSSIEVLVSKGYDNFINSGNDAFATENIKTFLNNFVSELSFHQLGLDIKKQEDAVKKAEKEAADAIAEAKRLESEREKIEKRMAENKTQQELKNRSVEEQKALLQELKSQLK